MVQEATKAVSSKPIFVKIRLLDTLEETLTLCEQLANAGASLIAIHARYRASWERKGPGARDGPALLEQVTHIRQHLHKLQQQNKIPHNVAIVTNGNTITYDDVQQNLQLTGAHGLMSAEGLLDNPALFLPRWGETVEESTSTGSTSTNTSLVENSTTKTTTTTASTTTIHNNNQCRIPWTLPIPPYRSTTTTTTTAEHNLTQSSSSNEKMAKKLRKVQKKLRKIARLEAKCDPHNRTTEEEALLAKKAKLQAQQTELQEKSAVPTTITTTTIPKDVSFSDLYKAANEKIPMAYEYLALVDLYPTTLRTVIFHIRRMCKDLLVQYQLLETCLQATSVADVRHVLDKIVHYQSHPTSFVYDKEKAAAEKEALERKKRQEGKRKEFEARMRRKAKREGRFDDLDYYLHQGATVPTTAFIQDLQKISDKSQILSMWKEKHGQHCLAFHMEGNCTRGRACAFLHVDSTSANTFNEQDEVAG
jgi:tRNA-dihydrouridine synthase 1